MNEMMSQLIRTEKGHIIIIIIIITLKCKAVVFHSLDCEFFERALVFM